MNISHLHPNTSSGFSGGFVVLNLKKNYIEGDLMELYDERLKASGERKADLKFIIDVLLLFRPGIIRPAEGFNM